MKSIVARTCLKAGRRLEGEAKRKRLEKARKRKEETLLRLEKKKHKLKLAQLGQDVWKMTYSLKMLRLEGEVDRGQSSRNCRLQDEEHGRQDEHPCVKPPLAEKILDVTVLACQINQLVTFPLGWQIRILAGVKELPV